VTVAIEQLRLAAALVHRSSGADLELWSEDRRFVVSRGRLDATLGPCSFRKIVLAAMRGNGEPLMHIERAQFVGGLREIGGGVYQRLGPSGSERRVAAFLSAAAVEALLSDGATEHDHDVAASVHHDHDLGVTVITITMSRAPSDLRLDAVAHRVAATCLVEELIAFADRDATA
jgi:hypothetical protein